MGLVFVILLMLGFWLHEKLTPTIPAENWANKDLIYKDRMSGMSEKEILRNVERGKYRIPKDEQKK